MYSKQSSANRHIGDDVLFTISLIILYIKEHNSPHSSNCALRYTVLSILIANTVSPAWIIATTDLPAGPKTHASRPAHKDKL